MTSSQKAIVAVGAAVVIAAAAVIPAIIPPPDTPFISAKGSKLYLNGNEFTFTGINAYGIANGCGGKSTDSGVDDFMSQLKPNSVVRTWAYPTTDFTGLDRALSYAGKYNLKLILTLSDQSGTCENGQWKDKAFYQSGYKTAYLDYVKTVVSRYKDSPAVAMWELINEPEASDCTQGTGSACYAHLSCPDQRAAATAMRGFFDTVGGEIKKIDKNHLISSGTMGSGQCGTTNEDYTYIHQSPGIDVASYHDYGNDSAAIPGDIWNGLQKRINQAKFIGKPIIVGEVGMLAVDSSTCISLAKRRDNFKVKMDAQFKAGVSGILPWAYAGGKGTFCNYDINKGDPTLALMREYPVLGPTIPPVKVPTDTQAPTNPTLLTALQPNQVTLTWQPSTDSVGVVRYDVFNNGQYFTSTTEPKLVLNNLIAGWTYVFFVKGKDQAGNSSGESNKVTVTIPVKPN